MRRRRCGWFLFLLVRSAPHCFVLLGECVFIRGEQERACILRARAHAEYEVAKIVAPRLLQNFIKFSSAFFWSLNFVKLYGAAMRIEHK